MAIAIFFLVGSISHAACQRRPVTDNLHIRIDPSAEKLLTSIGMAREQIIRSLEATAIPESHGCWSSASGDFDGQILSVGVAQWNYGQSSLQPLLRRYRESFANKGLFELEASNLMPTYWKQVFSAGCLQSKLTADCENQLKSVQLGGGKLTKLFQDEFNALFDSDLMTQIQADLYVKLLTGVASDLKRIFPSQTPKPLQVKWAIDTKVQQGGFPNDPDLQRIRDKIRDLSAPKREQALSAIIKWYEGLCESIDQDGVKFDCQYNKERWTRIIKLGKVDQDTLELILFSHLKSRTASGKSGLYQANTFQRRARIIFGAGSVHGNRSEE